MKKILAAALGALVVLSAGVYLFLIRPLLVPPEWVGIAESALATDDLVLLGGINVKQAVFLDRWFLGTPSAPVSLGHAAPPVPDRSMIDHLRAANVDARRDVAYAFFALYPTDGPALRRAIVLVGRFDTAAVNTYLERDLRGIPRSMSGYQSYEITATDSATCQPGPAWMLTVDPKWILITDSSSHPALLSRLRSPSPGGRAELSWWRALRRSDVMSLGVWNLPRLDSVVPRSVWKGSATALAAEADGFERLYVGLGVKTVPPEGVLRIVMDAKDASSGTQKIKAWQQAVHDSRARWADAMPSVATLYDSLRILADGPRSTVEFTVDRKLADNSGRVVTELLTVVLGGLGVKVSQPAAAPPAERIDSDPIAFVPSAEPAALPAYDPRAQFAEEVDQVQGPFGLRLNELRLGGEPGVGLELVVEGFVNGIPNIADGDERVRLSVESVKATGGQELLRPETCGRERNGQPAAFKSSGGRRLKAAKTLRLIGGADPRTLQSVTGRVQLRLPTRTEVVSLPHPTPGALAEKYGAIFTVTKVDAGSVSYQITGARDRVLLFRALNSKGQPLASSSSFSSDFLLGDGVSGQKQYSGAVDRLEVVFAAEEKAVEFPFALTDFAFAGKADGVSLDRTPPFRPYSYQALQREYSRSGRGGRGPDAWTPLPPRTMREPAIAVTSLEPFELSLDKARAFYALILDFTLRCPDVPNFQRAFAVGQLRLTRLQLKDGTEILPPAVDATMTPAAVGRSKWESAIHFTGEPKDGVLSTSMSLFIDTKAKPEDVKALQGILTVQFPKALETLAVDDLTVGQQAPLGALTVTVAAKGRKSLTLKISRDGDRVYYIRLIGADGQPVASFSPTITASPDGAWRFELSPFGQPTRAEVILAKEVDRKVYPVTLTIK
jgi:hypothetical protein